MAVIEPIINIVAKDSASDGIECLARLNEAASTCFRKPKKLLAIFIEQFVLPAQIYLNVNSAHRSLDESQNLAMILLASDILSQEIQSSVMANFTNGARLRLAKPNALCL